MSNWCQVRTAFLLDDKYPNLSQGVSDGWIWNVLNIETLPTGWVFTETDSSGARDVVVFEMDHAPTEMEFVAVEAVLQLLEQKYAARDNS